MVTSKEKHNVSNVLSMVHKIEKVRDIIFDNGCSIFFNYGLKFKAQS